MAKFVLRTMKGTLHVYFQLILPIAFIIYIAHLRNEKKIHDYEIINT